MGFTFVDLFSGIGGFHIAAVNNGGMCLQACDISPYAQKVYYQNFKIVPHDDIYTIKPKSNVDLVTFGSPCQPYSMAGQRKGLADDRGGKLLVQIIKYLKTANAKAFIMENVKGMVNINGGEDFKLITNKFKRLGYKLSVFVLNAKDFNVPQNRERVYIVGHKTIQFNDSHIKTVKLLKRAVDLFEAGLPHEKLVSPKRFHGLKLVENPNPTKNGIYLKGIVGRGYTQDRVLSSIGIIGAAIANWSPVVYDERYKVIRELSGRELLNFQGFPKKFVLPKGSRRDIIKAIGNAVCVPVITSIIKEMRKQALL